jgi:hypothetical protein
MQPLSLALKNFNDRVKQMNQSGSKQLMLSADEARNLHADIFILLANFAEAQATAEPVMDNVSISMDGGGFK